MRIVSDVTRCARWPRFVTDNSQGSGAGSSAAGPARGRAAPSGRTVLHRGASGRTALSHPWRTTATCQPFITLAPRIGLARSAPRSSPSSADLAAHVCTAVGRVDSAPTSIGTAFCTSAPCVRFPPKPAARRGVAPATSAASPDRSTGPVASTPCEHRYAPKAVGGKRCAARSPPRTPATTSTRVSLERARRARRLHPPIRCVSASPRRTNSPDSGPCSTRFASDASIRPTP